MRRLFVALVALSLVAVGCGSSHPPLQRVAGGTTSTTGPLEVGTVPSTTAAPAPPPANTPAPTQRRAPATTRRAAPETGGAAPVPGGPDLNAVRVRLTQVAALDQPLAMAVRAGDGALYFAQKTGRVLALRGGQVDGVPVLDLTGQVTGGAEQGLLGLAFSPDGSHLYVNYTDTAGDTHVVEYAMAGGRADPGSRRELLFVDQPFSNHNGGNLVFGPDGLLWIGLGDGGSYGDPSNNAQNPGARLGKMLRMDARTPGAQPQMWALGLRNPWRYSFDRANGDLWIGDVGQDAWEEVDFHAAAAPAGVNYGWSRYEGTHVYNSARSAPGAVPPITEYSHGGSACSVTGGYVYRGARIPPMNGAYLYADFCVGQVNALAQSAGRAVGQRQLGLHASNLSSFGEDQAGEVYVLSLDGPVYRIDPG